MGGVPTHDPPSAHLRGRGGGADCPHGQKLSARCRPWRQKPSRRFARCRAWQDPGPWAGSPRRVCGFQAVPPQDSRCAGGGDGGAPRDSDGARRAPEGTQAMNHHPASSPSLSASWSPSFRHPILPRPRASPRPARWAPRGGHRLGLHLLQKPRVHAPNNHRASGCPAPSSRPWSSFPGVPPG